MHFFANFHQTNSKAESNFWFSFGLLNRILKTFCQFILIFSLVFGIFGSLPVRADNGVIGFSDCNFGSAEVVRKTNNAASGNETIRKCFQQILTFIFVLGVFLIGMRIGLEAFKSLNPTIQGSSIDNSVKLGKDVMIGLILIGAPSLFLGLFNEAALQLPNLFDLGKFATNAKPTSSKTPGSGTGTNNGGTGTPGTGGTAATPTTLTLPDGTVVNQKDIKDAQKAKEEFDKNGKPPLTDKQNQILEKLKNQTPTTVAPKGIYVNPAMPDVPKAEVEASLKQWNENRTSGNSETTKNLTIVRSVLENCITSKVNPTGGDQTSCDLLKKIEASDRSVFVEYDSSKPLNLPAGFIRTNPINTKVTGTDKDYNIQLRNSKNQEITIKMNCPSGLAVAETSPLNKDTFTYESNTNLNPVGCTSTMKLTKL